MAYILGYMPFLFLKSVLWTLSLHNNLGEDSPVSILCCKKITLWTAVMPSTINYIFKEVNKSSYKSSFINLVKYLGPFFLSFNKKAPSWILTSTKMNGKLLGHTVTYQKCSSGRYEAETFSWGGFGVCQYTFSDHLFIKHYIYCTNISIAQIIF